MVREDFDAWLEDCASAVALAESCELVEVVVHRRGSKSSLEITIDRPGGVTVDDCARVSRALSAHLENADPLDQAYLLQVTSPGLTRPLKKPMDFERFRGRLAIIDTREHISGRNHFRGRIEGLTANGDVRVYDDQSASEIVVPWSLVASSRLDFEGDRSRARRGSSQPSAALVTDGATS